jgi:divinyl protochlorophyllide a 8-vinyl-reductase
MTLTHAGRIGPNALIQTASALSERYEPLRVRHILEGAGLEHLLAETPSEMVEEQSFHALVVSMLDLLGPTAVGEALARAGELTAGYLLAHRIPRPAQWLLRPLPPGPALAALLPAIAKNAWTFGESGAFSYTLGHRPQITIANHALCDTPEVAGAICHFYQGTFRTLFRTLVHPEAQLREAACQGRGDATCVYEIIWRTVESEDQRATKCTNEHE